MKIVQKFFAFGLLLAVGLVIAGCSETKDKAAPAKPAAGTGDKMEKKEGGASNSLKGDFQLVSLNVPNMT